MCRFSFHWFLAANQKQPVREWDRVREKESILSVNFAKCLFGQIKIDNFKVRKILAVDEKRNWFLTHSFPLVFLPWHFTKMFPGKESDGQPKCPPSFDGYLCWYNDGEPNTKLALQCPQIFESANNKARRECRSGQWSGRADYSECGANRFSVNIFVNFFFH